MISITTILKLFHTCLLGFIVCAAAVAGIELLSEIRATDEPDLDLLVLPHEAVEAPEQLMGAPFDEFDIRAERVDSDIATTLAAPLDGMEQDLLSLQVVVEPRAGARISEIITELDGAVTGRSAAGDLLQILLPVQALPALSTRPEVLYLRQPQLAYPLTDLDSGKSGEVETNFASKLGVEAWHLAGWTGKGIRVGIVDSGFAGLPQLQGNELPAYVHVASFVDGGERGAFEGNTRHGSAVAEIVSGIAPEASLYLARVQTNIDLGEAIDWLLEEQVDIIVSAIGWYNLTPGDGSGEFANLAARAQDAGALWISAAGNDRENHWGGLFQDPDRDGYHNFSLNQEVNFFGPGGNSSYLIGPGQRMSIHVRWQDWNDVRQDFDLLIVRWTGSMWEVVASSRNPQSGSPGQRPIESLTFTTSGEPTAYGFLIRKHSGSVDRPINIEVFVPRFLRPSQVTSARSLPNIADVPQILTVGAVDGTAPGEVLAYSGEGPTNGPGGSLDGGHPKPDLVSFTNVATTSYGGLDPFGGTSAAAPHVAGAAALLAQAYPHWGPTEIGHALTNSAIDISTPGFDPRSGAGRLALQAAPANLVHSRSSMHAPHISAGERVTVSLRIVNSGQVTSAVTARNPLPNTLSIVSEPRVFGGGRAQFDDKSVDWSGPIGPGKSILIQFVAQLKHPQSEGPLRVVNQTFLSDNEGRKLVLTTLLNPAPVYLPLAAW